MAVPNKARLRNALKKMRRIPAPDPATAAQEALDLLSTMAGIKPVTLLGRGYGSAAWLEGLLGIAGEAGLHVVQGPYWDAGADAGLPDWYLEHARRSLAGLRAYYICRARVVAAEVAAIPENGAIRVEQEARLLGYPECCVRGYYRAAAAHQRVWLDMARSRAGGGEEAAAQLLGSGEKIDPETEEEKERLEEATKVAPVPFTSFNACDACAAGGPDSPAALKSRQAYLFAAAIDRDLAAILSR